MAPTIRIDREDAKWRDKLREYEVVVDGTSVGTVSNGQVVDFPVEAGEHIVRLRVGFIGSRELPVEVPPGGRVTLLCSPAGQQGHAIKMSVVGLFRRNAWIILTPAP